MVAPPTPRLRLVYILGSGRCGSTILDSVIGTAPLALSTGELDKIGRARAAAEASRGAHTLSLCSCGQPVTTCPLWSPVWDDLRGRYDVAEYGRDLARFERVLLSIPAASWGRLAGTRAFRRHLNATGFLLQSIAHRAGASVIVDSSKNPTRGWLYSLLPEAQFDVRLVHIVRDGRRVLASNLAHFHPDELVSEPSPWSPTMTSFYSTAYWSYMNLHASLLGLARRRPYRLLRYEDLVARPQETLVSLEAFLGVDLSLPRERVAQSLPLARGHLLHGNRSKTAPTLTVQADPLPPVALPLGAAAAFGSLGSWLDGYYRQRGLASGIGSARRS
jgi:hypothetical protein